MTCLPLLMLALVSMMACILVCGCTGPEKSQDITLTGTIIYNDLEGGFYGLNTDDGQQYLPLDLPDAYKKDGMRVRMTGVPDPDVMTIQMWGTPFKITSITAI